MDKGPAQAGESIADGKVACLICDSSVLVNREKWKEKEMSAAICRPCFDAVGSDQRLVRALMLTQLKVRDLSEQVDVLRNEVRKLQTRH